MNATRKSFSGFSITRMFLVSSLTLALLLPILEVTSHAAGANPSTTWGQSAQAWTSAGSSRFDAADIACTSAAACVIVGQAPNQNPEAQVLAKGTWNAQKITPPKGYAGARLISIACPALGRCIAVGNEWKVDGSSVPFFAQQSPTGWTSKLFTSIPRAAKAPWGASFSAISCPSITSCTAVGFANRSGQAFVATKSASAWSKPMLLGDNSEYAYPTDIACTSSSTCVVIAEGDVQVAFTETSNGHWTKKSLATIAGLSRPSLSGLSCNGTGSALTCRAVGSITANGSQIAIWAKLASGNWTGATLALPHGATLSSLTQISCSSASSCLAIGTAVSRVPYLQRYSTAHGWQDAGTLLSGSWNAANANALACASGNNCTIAGTVSANQANFTRIPSAMSTTGSTFTIKTLKTTSPPFASYGGASCPTTGHCFAIGNAELGDTGTALLFGTLLSGSWTMKTLSGPSAASFPSARAISCPNVNLCYIVGSQKADAPDARAILMTLRLEISDSGAVTSVNSRVLDPDPGADYNLADLSCADSTHCIAVGADLGIPVDDGCGNCGRQGTPNPLVLSLDGSVWTSSIGGDATPNGLGTGSLDSVSCVSAVWCEAMGQSVNWQSSFALQFDGSTWTRSTLPAFGSDNYASITQLSCPSIGSCVALGNGPDGSGRSAVLASGDWQVFEIANSMVASSNFYLQSISCSSMSNCAAVGSSFSNQGLTSPLILTGSASRWAALKVTGRTAKDSSSNVVDVSCVSAQACVAVGSQGDFPNLTPTILSSAAAPNSAPTLNAPPLISSSVGSSLSRDITTSGWPDPSLSSAGGLPAGLSFEDHGDGTATISGTPRESGSF
ncbi:MAG: hypothetical protein WCJ28_03160, partial [Actinomycetota bacterium]